MDLYAENVNLVMADAGSKKRLQALCSSRYDEQPNRQKPIFDDRAYSVIKEYAFDAKEIENAVRHFDSVGYGSTPMPQHLLDALDRFTAQHAPSRKWMSGFRQAKEHLSNKLREEGLTRLAPIIFIDDDDIYARLPKLDAHAGWGYVQTGLKHKGDYVGQLYSTWREMLDTVKEKGSHGCPILPGSRLQCSGGFEDGVPIFWVKHKERLVNMIDYRQIISEMVFSIPLQDAMSYCTFYIGSRNPDELSRLINDRRGSSKFWISLDYSSFDQSIPGWLIEEAFDVLWNCYDPKLAKPWKWLWDAMVFDFIHAPIVGPDGVLYYRKDGVPSGSMFTQIIDTIVNWLMIETWKIMKEKELGYLISMNMLICGDDNLIFMRDECDPKQLEAEMLSYIEHNFGVKGHADKLGTGNCRRDDPHFLSRDWRLSGAWREWHELVGHMLYPERFRDYFKNAEMRPEMILWSYILAYPQGMKDFIDVKYFVETFK